MNYVDAALMELYRQKLQLPNNDSLQGQCWIKKYEEGGTKLKGTKNQADGRRMRYN